MRTAILLSTPVDPEIEQLVAEGRHPKPDFLALAEDLNTDIIAPISPRRRPQRKVDKLRGFLKVAWTGFMRRKEYDVLISDQDRVGMLLAMLLKLVRARQHHVMICHGKIAFGVELRLTRLLRLHTHIHHFICYGPEIAERVGRLLPVAPEQVSIIPHAADHAFWQPMNGTVRNPLIVSGGMLDRDYPTLIEAARTLKEVSVVISGYSPWVSSDGFWTDHLPPHVTLTRCNYEEMRELYARSLFVAVPLQPTPSQSGSLVAYEAMAMGKPVVITRTAGQEAMEIIQNGETGFYIEPGDVDGWRRIITYLSENPEVASAMGQRAREAVENGLNMDTYTETMQKVMQRVGEDATLSPERSRQTD